MSDRNAWALLVALLGGLLIAPGILRVGLTPFRRANTSSFVVGIAAMVMGMALVGIALLVIWEKTG